jgi:hypothetical protein
MGEDRYSEEGLSPAEFTRRGPESDPSQGAAAGPGAPETDEPRQGRDPDVGGPGGPAPSGMDEGDDPEGREPTGSGEIPEQGPG